MFSKLTGVLVLLAVMCPTPPATAKGVDFDECAKYWACNSRAATEPNPFVEGGTARQLERFVDLGDITATVSASEFDSYAVVVVPRSSTEPPITVQECPFPIGWKVKTARPKIEFDPLLAFHNDEGGSHLQARNGVVFIARGWRDNQRINALVAWTLRAQAPTDRDVKVIRGHLSLPPTHNVTVAEPAQRPGSTGVAIKFSLHDDARVQTEMWSVFSSSAFTASNTSDEKAFLPGDTLTSFDSLLEVLQSACFRDLQGFTAWDSRRERRACADFDSDTIASMECSKQIPLAVNDLFELAERERIAIYAHVVWKTPADAFALSALRLTPDGNVTVEQTELLDDPSELGLPDGDAIQEMEWP